MQKIINKVSKYSSKGKAAKKGIMDPDARDKLIQEYASMI